MVWDPPIRMVRYLFGAPAAASAPALVVLSLALTLALGPPLRQIKLQDPILFGVPFIFHLFFIHHALLGPGKDTVPGSLKMCLATIISFSLAIHAKAAGLFFNSRKKDVSSSFAEETVNRVFDCLQNRESLQTSHDEHDIDFHPQLRFLLDTYTIISDIFSQS